MKRFSSLKAPRRTWRYWATAVLMLIAYAWLGGIVIGRVWESPLDVGWLLILGLYLYVGTAVWVGFSATRPSRVPIFMSDPEDVGFAYEPVMFESRDGLMLKGWFVPSQNGAAVVCAHGFRENRLGSVLVARMLVEEGYGVLVFDLRGHGESEGNLSTGGWAEIDDLLGAVDFVCHKKHINPKRLGVFGFSLGGQIALRAAAQDKRIAAVTTDGASAAVLYDHTYANRLQMSRQWLWNLIAYRVQRVLTGVAPPQEGVMQSMERIGPRAVLLIAAGGRNERNCNREFFRRAKEPRELWVVPEARHGRVIEERPEEYQETVLDFFDFNLLG